MYQLDYEFKNNESNLLYLPNTELKYFSNIENLLIKSYKLKNIDNNYYSSNTVKKIIKHFIYLQNLCKEPLNNDTLSKINKLNLKCIYNIFQLNLNILSKKLSIFDNKFNVELKQILTHKFKYKNVINLEFINLGIYCKLNLKFYNNYYKYDYISYNEKISEMVLYKEKEKSQKLKDKENRNKYKKDELEYQKIKENQMMYMNDPYILKLKENAIEYFYNAEEKFLEEIFYNTSMNSKCCKEENYYYISYIMEQMINEYGDNRCDCIFKQELKQGVKLFKLRYKNNEHFRNKKINYNYKDIKQRNKKLNQEFKRVYKLISKNIGFNLLSN